tara:strand:+ start:1154 stop:2254 length:1101 start_codon:yes stop_codon:yes gene_type:complete
MANKIVTFTTYKNDGLTSSGTPFVFGFTDKLGNNQFDNTGDSVDADLEIPPPPPPGDGLNGAGNPISTSYIDTMYVKVNDGTNDINAYKYLLDISDNNDIALDLAVRDYNANNVVFKYNHSDISGVLGTLNITNDSWTIDLVDAIVTGSGGSNPSVIENGDERTVTLPHLADNNSFYTMNLKQYVVDSGPTEVTQTISLNAGWNLISFYVDLNNASPATVFASLISSSNLLYVSKYDSGSTKYDPNGSSRSNTLKIMLPNFGYWVNITNAENINVTGTVFNGPLQLNNGWNLISFYLETTVLSPATVFASLISNNNLLYVSKYDNGSTKYDPNGSSRSNTLKIMLPNFGYWVNVNDAVTDYFLSTN